MIQIGLEKMQGCKIMVALMFLIVICLAARAASAITVILVTVIATAVAVILAASRRRHKRALFAARPVHGHAAPWDQRPTRANRRLLARSLRTSIRRTSFTSLFPGIDARADRIVAAAGAILNVRR